MKLKVFYPACIGVLACLLTSCIKNDFPLPTIECAIEGFGTEGMTSVKIDAEARTVMAKVTDTLDLRDIRITRLEVTGQAKVLPDPKSCIDFAHFPDSGFVSADSLPATANTRVNFENPVLFTLSLYQDYPWTVTVERDINRIVKVKNMVGFPLIDEDNFHVVIFVDSVSQPKLSNIEIETLQLGPSNAVIQPEPSLVTDFTRPRIFRVTAFGETQEWTVSVRYPTGDEARTTTLSAWAKRAYLQGETRTGQVSARYRLAATEGSDAGEWESALSNEIEIREDGSFTVVFAHLKPETTYEFEVTVDGRTEEARLFTTEPVVSVPNLSFDDWYKDGKSWYPNIDLSEENYFWDSGNKGSNAVGEANPTSPETNDVVRGKAARMESKTVAGVFAAGSVYTGSFGRVEGLSGASLNFGRPYTGRPSALKGYYKCNVGTIDKARAPYESLLGTKDTCRIYIALFTWDKPFPLNTNTGTLVDLTWDNESMVAFGDLKQGETVKDYTPFTIPLTYRDYSTKPTYLLIVASASQLGDYFTGSTSNVLLLDECELVFE